jgi:hypothetical protein
MDNFMTAHNLLIVIACICEFLSAIGIPSGSVNLVALGLAFFFLSLLVR